MMRAAGCRAPTKVGVGAAGTDALAVSLVSSDPA